MIPYVELHTISLGPLAIQVWGTMVALGILVGAKASEWMLKQRGYDKNVVWDSLSWLLGGALLGARLFHVFFYDPVTYGAHPLEVFAIWHGGLSIMGGFFGAVVGFLWFAKRRQLDPYAYADAMIFGLPLGLFIGRIGCFLIHDHPGTASDFMLAVKYPDGVTRHDHGLYLSLNGLLLFVTFLLMARSKAREGMYLVVFLVWYGAVRFGLDFLRAYDGAVVDERYLGLTPAQYLSLGFIIAGFALYGRIPKRRQRGAWPVL